MDFDILSDRLQKLAHDLSTLLHMPAYREEAIQVLDELAETIDGLKDWLIREGFMGTGEPL